ncbi:MAG: DHHA1 domain-containing protein [archaeon]
MITSEEIKKIRDYLEKSENPLFFFDDDPDGLSCFLLLYKHIEKGHGVMVKGTPKLGEEYLRKVQEYHPDKIFVLDKPHLSQDFIDKVNVPIIYIDHHPPNEIKGAHYFNPLLHDKEDNRPTCYWCYKVTEQNEWIAMTGIVGDWFLPEQVDKKFKNLYKDLLPKVKDPGEARFNTPIGILTKIFSFILKGKSSDVMRCVRILTRVKTPEEILNQTTKEGKYIYKYYETVNKRYEKMLAKAESMIDTKENFLLYTYPSGKDSFTGMLSEELTYKYPDKTIVIGRNKEDRVVMSLRSQNKDIRSAVEKAKEGLDGYGGGHEHACGSNISKKDFPKFITRIKKYLKEQN